MGRPKGSKNKSVVGFETESLEVDGSKIMVVEGAPSSHGVIFGTFEEDAHAEFPPSSMNIILACAGAPSLWRKSPPSKTSKYAEEGTRAHEAAAKILTNETGFSIFKKATEGMDGEMKSHIYDYITWAMRLPLMADAEQIFTEEKVYLDKNLGIWGTLDRAWTFKENGKTCAAILDLKYGQGHVVEVGGNPQLITYACAMEEMRGPFDHIDIYIFQPRAEHPDGALRKAQLNNMKKWKQVIIDACTRSKRMADGELTPEFNPGEHCLFCRAKEICRARADYEHGSAAADFEVVAEAEKIPESMLTPEQVVRMFEAKPRLESFLAYIKQLEEYTANQVLSGKPFPGLKVVKGKRGGRKWIDDKDLVACTIKKLGCEPFSLELKGITEVEKVVGKGKIDDITTQPEAPLRVVPESDPRPSVQLQLEAAKDFVVESTGREDDFFDNF